jgi:hypothetical protein
MGEQAIPDLIPWDKISGPLATAEDALARLDERLRSSPIAGGWISRTHFQDACASLWLAGELVTIEDLVLHDARMDVRSPTHELTRAQAALRTRRRIAGGAPNWAMSAEGLAILRGDGDSKSVDAARADEAADCGDETAPGSADDAGADPLAEELAALDRAAREQQPIPRRRPSRGEARAGPAHL